MPQLLKPKCPRAHALQQEKPPQGEAYMLQLVAPVAETGESLLTAMMTQHSQKEKRNKKGFENNTCPSTENWKYKVWYSHMMEYYAATTITKNKNEEAFYTLQ